MQTRRKSMSNEYERAARNSGETATSQAAKAFDAGTATAEDARKTGATVQGNVSENVSQVAGRVQETAEKAVEVSAKKMHDSADKIREKVDGLGGAGEKAGMAVADRVDQSADYLQERDTGRTMANVESFVRRHPVQSMVGALVIGFVVGRRVGRLW
jgi:ElaB/YqjD/DUF883 family membrane-anchored ribosome-binding protein